jgi:uncharacterized membrane protein
MDKYINMLFPSDKVKSDFAFVLLILALTTSLFFIPTGFESLIEQNAERVSGLILNTDNSNIQQFGIVKTGDQDLRIKILEGKYKGKEVDAVNRLMGKMEFDSVFKEGDKVLVVLEFNKDGDIRIANVRDHYRINLELILVFIFVIALIFFAGWTGVKAMLSFVFTALLLWKVLLPAFLRGWNPILTSLSVVVILTAVIIFSVGGLNRKSIVAFIGSLMGVILTCILSILFTYTFKIHGAVSPFAETLLYSGFPHLNLTAIFLSGIFIASSGAVMDIAMDISASMNELIQKNPNINLKEAIISGIEVGKAVIGTMTTTLLLAYSGGYTAMFMVFIAQGTPIINVLNLNYVAAEILHTIVGSFGLVTVAPFTAIVGGFVFLHRKSVINH